MFNKTTFFIKLIGLFVFMAFVNTAIPKENVIQFEGQQGRASYYAGKFDGRKTASGAIYRNKEYTCAHRSLPFGTLLKVTNLKNNRSVMVKVTDRGPFVKGRIIDISRVAAKEIDMINAGTAFVSIELAQPDQFDILPCEAPVLTDADCMEDKYQFED